MKAYGQYTLSVLHDGESGLELKIRSSEATVQRGSMAQSTLTAELRRGELVLGAEERETLGVLSWFRNGCAVPEAEGESVHAETAGAALFEARLERFGQTLRGASLCLDEQTPGRGLRRLTLYPKEGVRPGVLWRCGKNLVENLRAGTNYSTSFVDAVFDSEGRYTLKSKSNTLSNTQTLSLNPLTNYNSSSSAVLYELPDLFVLRAGHSYLVKDCTLGGFTGDATTRVAVNSSALKTNAHRSMSYHPTQDLHVKQVRAFVNPQSAYDGAFCFEPMVCEGTDAAFETYCGERWEIAFPEGAESYAPSDLAVTTLAGSNTLWTDAGELSFVWETETLASAQISLACVKDGANSYLHVKYSNDGESFTALNGEVLGTWIGTLVDQNEEASGNFADYSWKRFSDDTELRREVTAYTDRQIEALRSVYLAKSDFGSFSERINTQIEQTARGVVESYDYEELIEGAARSAQEAGRALTELGGQIRRGILEDPETGELHFGIAISEKLSFTGETQERGGRVYYRLSPGQTLGLYTSLGWQFWINGVKCGYFSSADSMLHVSNSAIENAMRLGADWTISGRDGFGLRYTGG